MGKVHPSKIGLELAIPLAVVLGSVFFLALFQEGGIWGALIVLLVGGFILHLFLNTFYRIENHTLHIKCGFLYNATIDIYDIKKIAATKNPLSAPATSLDRLEIVYGKNDFCLISPNNKKSFVADILAVNPAVEIKL
jgi:hypothetical protein